jgi:death-on-curing protein
MSIRYLEVEEIIEIHDQMIDHFGGRHGLNGSSGQGLIDSAAQRPRNKAAYEDADVLTQAGALFFGLAKNHGFLDGNKRTAVAATDAFLQMNGWELACDNDTIASFTERCSDAA